MITPRWIGSTSKASATGTMSGATTMIAEKISITQPSTIINEVQDQQEDPRRIDRGVDPDREPVRHMLGDQQVREAHRRAQYQEHAADEQSAFAQDLDQPLAARQVAVDERRNQDRVSGGQRRRGDRQHEAAENQHDRHDRQQQVPFRAPGRRRPRAAN